MLFFPFSLYCVSKRMEVFIIPEKHVLVNRIGAIFRSIKNIRIILNCQRIVKPGLSPKLQR